jgi:Fe-S-cluster-containing hydrogenase component 2
VIPDLNPTISHKIGSMPGVEVVVEENCSGCELCTNGICFTNAILMENGRAKITQECRGCGRCVEICPEKAISLTINGRADFREVISRLDKLIDGK